MNSGGAILIAVGVVLLILWPRRAVERSGIGLVRTLLPSWRFFEAPDLSYVLWARSVETSGPGSYVLIPPRRAWRPVDALFAPSGNLALACHGLVESLMNELAELGPTPLSEVEGRTSFRLVQNAVCYYLAGLEPSFEQYQFKVVAADPHHQGDEELLVSPVYARRAR